MKLYSTNDKENVVDLKEAVLNSLPVDKGLYLPVDIPILDKQFLHNLSLYSFKEIAFQVCSALFEEYIPAKKLWDIVEQSINFPAPVIQLNDQISVLELFHGPSLAFKDFGARFMAQLMSYFNEGENKKLTVLVATSGDTGGAVAAGFLNSPGIEVVILYPSGRVSPLQEKQLTSLGGNIHACEISGDFDDCQRLVKKAFLDTDLKRKYRFSSANSINIARLIPQSFYYINAYKQVQDKSKINFCVPSGNLGNVTAGILAKKMGLPVHKFLLATNANRVVPRYLETGNYIPTESIPTISNAMDVSNPSNFVRLEALYDHNYYDIKEDVLGFSYTDELTIKGMISAFENDHYVCDPHGAIGYLAAHEYITRFPDEHVVFLETAHPSKFKETVESSVRTRIQIPERLAVFANRKKEATALTNSFEEFKSFLNSRT